MDDTRPAAIRRILPAAIAGLFFLVVAVLYATGRWTIYENILRTWGVDLWRFPFLDLDGVLSAARCFRDGVDVYAGNPCDPLRRPNNYSPLWLALAWLPVTKAWLMPAGVVLSGSFIASLALLPPGRGAVATGVIVLGAVSSAVVFAVERGNNDLVLFLLVAVGAALACRTPMLRLIGYASILLAGLLKYYPMTLMALATRERPRRFFVIAAATVAVVALCVITMGNDFSRSFKLIPLSNVFADAFGSASLPRGLARLNGWSSSTELWLRIALSIAAAGAGLWLGRRPALEAALDRLTELERMTLLAGGLLIISCYFTATNVGYRAMHLVLTLPALTALVRLGAGRLWIATTATVLGVLWAQSWRNWVSDLIPGRPVVVGAWVTRDLLWWWTITMMIALVIALLHRSEMGRRAFRRVRTESQP